MTVHNTPFKLSVLELFLPLSNYSAVFLESRQGSEGMKMYYKSGVYLASRSFPTTTASHHCRGEHTHPARSRIAQAIPPSPRYCGYPARTYNVTSFKSSNLATHLLEFQVGWVVSEVRSVRIPIGLSLLRLAHSLILSLCTDLSPSKERRAASLRSRG